MKDAQWQLAENLSFRYAQMENNQWPKSHTINETTDTAFAVKHKPQGTKKLHQEYFQKSIYIELQGGSQIMLCSEQFKQQGDH